MVRTLSKLAIVLAGAVCAPASAFTVFACEPEWAALTRVLMPDATVHTATHSRQDPHHIEARPALIAQLRSADLAVCTGASLESGWLPALQQRAGNAKVQDGAQGMFYAASQVELIDAQPGAGGNPFAGDIHAEGNPHVHADPRNLVKISSRLAERLQTLVPAEAQQIRQRQSQFETAWSQRIGEWEKRAAPLRGQMVAAQHTAFGYLWKWLGLKQIADLEPKPGMAPTPGHLQGLLSILQAQPPLAIVTAGYQDQRAGRWLVSQLDSKVPLISLPATVDDERTPDALAQWYEQLINSLMKAKTR
ncbi:zinc ABC transporter substrate-binding protein [Noviherbaspirillum sp. CPCC 100848]|uniref:Zinc ABC transporter substrate-binding protein n=1 Tax=Noviherbaspirillum album TaxID=3080276 RepID=A0ABU6J8V6_9BURK|nr:zinc ABC transporter substrate-binding protein [Noviherbaspirillum sp. CPCC 100848]MEC4720077.1 zinc ABC transporter substrate-binding protein [Noviherbaspirillum sp. CPCC 100848]